MKTLRQGVSRDSPVYKRLLYFRGTEQPQPWRARRHRSWRSRVSGGDSNLPQPCQRLLPGQEQWPRQHTENYTKERPQPWRARRHRSWRSRVSGGDSSLLQPLALQILREEVYAHSHPLAWRQNPHLLPLCKAEPGQRFIRIRL
jgi:hypothetical protein